jgi:predicted ribosome quality control (RQC) complex YloA/Tae2 family protein
MAQGMNGQELELLAGALAGRLVGTVLQEVRQGEALHLRLALRRPGESLFLHFCLDPELPFAGLAPDHGPSRPDPEPLVLKLRADLTGALLIGLRRPSAERARELVFRGRGEGEGEWILRFQAFGRSPALLLLRDGEVVLGLPARGALAEAGRQDRGGRVREGQEEASPEAPLLTPEELFVGYQQRLAQRRLEVRRANLDRALRRSLDKSLRLLEKLKDDEAEARRRLEAGARADLLKPSLHLVKPRASRVLVLDWSNDCAEVWVDLDPALSPAKNLERLYREFKKGKTALRIVAERRAEVRLRVAQVELALGMLSRLEPEAFEALEAQEQAGSKAGRGKAKGKPGATVRALPWRVFASASGRELLVGRSAAGNAELTFREARPWDVWLHVRGAPGSHVVMRMAKGEELDQESLVDAAHLAAFYSDLRKDPSPEVIWAERRFLRSVKGRLGEVLVTRERVLQLRVDQARLERLGGK